MRFTPLVAAMERSGDSWRVVIPPDWAQGRSVFGGLQAALALRAMRPFANELPLRVLQTTFVAPLPPSEARVEARLLRTGKTTAHVAARIWAGSDLAATVTGVFGASRPSELLVSPRAPEVPGRATLFDREPDSPLPAFLQHFAIGWRRGDPPGAGCTATSAVIDLNFHDDGPVTEEHAVAIADVVPPHALSMLRAPSFGSSLTWTLEMLHGGRLAHLALDGWRVDVELLAALGGYTSQSVLVWGPGGVPVAISRQCMVVFG